jgi:hypothetical protein
MVVVSKSEKTKTKKQKKHQKTNITIIQDYWDQGYV